MLPASVRLVTQRSLLLLSLRFFALVLLCDLTTNPTEQNNNISKNTIGEITAPDQNTEYYCHISSTVSTRNAPWGHFTERCAFSNQVQPTEFTRGGLQLKCGNTHLMLYIGCVFPQKLQI